MRPLSLIDKRRLHLRGREVLCLLEVTNGSGVQHAGCFLNDGQEPLRWEPGGEGFAQFLREGVVLAPELEDDHQVGVR